MNKIVLIASILILSMSLAYAQGIDPELLKKAKAGDAEAQNNIGVIYAKGQEVPQDYKKAVEWYAKAANQGNATAQLNLGFMYQQGQGITQDYNKAIEWYTKAANQGNSDAQFNLGVIYQYGQGVPIDYKAAVEWYAKAVNQGNSHAQLNLGVLYSNGQGVTQDYNKAFELYTKAAKQGNNLAQIAVGILYLNGSLGEENIGMGCAWLFIAKNDAGTKECLKVMNKAQIREAVTFIMAKGMSMVEEDNGSTERGAKFSTDILHYVDTIGKSL